MTPQIFINELEHIFDRTLKPAQAPVYLDKLRRFSSDQLMEMLNKVLEEAKYFPKVSEIYKAAQELGFLHVDTTHGPKHHWEQGDCPLCEGEGRLAIFWQYFGEVHGDALVEVHRLSKIMAYSSSLQHLPSDPNISEFRSIWRCRCSAGDVQTIPKAWPKWGNHVEPYRNVYK